MSHPPGLNVHDFSQPKVEPKNKPMTDLYQMLTSSIEAVRDLPPPSSTEEILERANTIANLSQGMQAHTQAAQRISELAASMKAELKFR
ncbi:MAG: hypothetical protein KAW93_07740 [Methanogenium sp.]|nr:hypothetical protein [Methanogenium sp.]